MALAHWMRAIDVLNGLAQFTGRGRRAGGAQDGGALAPGGPLGAIETRLVGVMMAALKEAFDRDSARLELERSQIEAEQRRAEEALRAELRRQNGERALSQLRMIAVMAIGLWALSAVLTVWLPGMEGGLSRGLLGAGWLLAIASLGTAFAGWRRISDWSADTQPDSEAALRSPATMAAPWLLVGALALTAASVLAGL